MKEMPVDKNNQPESSVNTNKKFEILFRKKIPYWSEFLLSLLMVFFVCLFLFYLFMYPSKGSTEEMQVAYYMLVVPDWLKIVSAYSFLGFGVVLLLYNVSKSYHPRSIQFFEEYFLITDTSPRQIPVKSIRKIFFNDVRRWIKKPRQATEIVITQTGSRKTSFLLKNYDESEEFVDCLSKLEIEFAFYNELSINTHDDD
jgi:hypothetical protein